MTVVVPCLDEADTIIRCLDSIRAQSHADLEILVVDGGSTDGTQTLVDEAARTDGRIRLLHNPDRVVPSALNRALDAAQGRWLVRVDAHATVPQDYVATAVGHLMTGRWGGVGGRKDGVGRTPAGRAIAAAMASRFGVGGSTYHHGTQAVPVDHVPFGAYPVELVRELGGWDESLAVNQDYEFDYRVRESGRELLFDPTLRIDWECRQSIPALFRQYRRYGRGKTKVLLRHPASASPRHLAAPGLLGLLGLAGALFSRRRPRPAILLLLPYAGALCVASWRTARELEDLPAKVRVPVAFLAMHVGWGLGFWEGWSRILRGRDPNQAT